MRVALMCNVFPPEFRGGTERVVAALARALRAAGHDVCVIAGSERPHQGEDVTRHEVDGIPVLVVPRQADESYGLEIERPRVLAVISGLWRERDIELVHVHHWANLSSSLLRRASAEGRATVATLHDLWVTCGRFFRRAPDGLACPEGTDRQACGPCVQRSFEREPLWKLRLGVANRDREVAGELRAAAAVTAPSATCARRLAQLLPWPVAVEVVPHGLLERIERRAAAPAEGSPVRIGTFGHLVADKGVSVLVEAMRGLDGAELHLAGGFLDRDFRSATLARAAELGVRVIDHGAFEVGGEHPATALDLAVFPSLCEETYGLVVDEALARGVPAVVSDAGALPERVAGGGGEVVPAGDADALRNALASLCEPARRARLATAIPSKFPSIEDAAERYQALYAAAREVCR